MLSGGYPKYILGLSVKYGEAANQLIHQILSVHANLNCRRALGFLSIMEKYHKESFFSKVCEKSIAAKIIDPKIFKYWMDQENQGKEDELFKLSEAGAEMTQEAGYYFH